MGQPSRPPLAPKVDKPGAFFSNSEKQREIHFNLFIEPLGKRSVTTEKDNFFLRMFHDLLEKNIPREVGALSSENAVVFIYACYERDHPTWPCGLGGVVFACGRVFFFSLAADEKLRTLLGEKF